MSFMSSSLFFFNDTATTEIYTLSLHDALPIARAAGKRRVVRIECAPLRPSAGAAEYARGPSERTQVGRRGCAGTQASVGPQCAGGGAGFHIPDAADGVFPDGSGFPAYLA